MNKDVLITISGMQAEYADTEGIANETVEVINPATYFFKDGLHYIFFEELQEGTPGVTKSKIVFKEHEFLEVIKKGVMNSAMRFECGEYHESNYETPYGQMLIGVKAQSIDSEITEGRIILKVVYELIVNCEAYAACEIRMKITDKMQGM